MQTFRHAGASMALVAMVLLGGCAAPPATKAPARPEDVRARIVALLPATVADRPAWAVDIYAAFSALHLEPGIDNVCAVLAIAEQESTYRADPAVPGLGRIAREEIDRRAEHAGVPKLLVDAALHLRSQDSRSYSERIEAARAEKELSDVFEDFIAQVPLGQRFFAGYNPVRTGEPMQVSVEFSFQSAITIATGIALELDGDLIVPGGDSARPGTTEAALRSLGTRLGVDESEIRRALEQESRLELEQTRVYARVFELADQVARHALPRAVLPRIRLQSPKITRPLTTEWFARRVEERYRHCLAKAG